MQDKDVISTLSWLLDAGADEAVGEEPVNRLKTPSHPPLEGAEGRARAQGRPGESKREAFRGGATGSSTDPSPENPRAERANFSPLPQGEGRKSLQSIASEDSIGTAIASAAAANNLAELKAALERFDGCALKRSAANTVFADGNPAGGVMFIGEAPGRDEDRIGKPFVGRAGQLLDKMLASVGLSRQTNAYITNVINWRPPDNRDPSPEEAAMCLPFLRRHIELADPKLLVLLGAVAARHVIGLTDGIMRSRGRWLEYRVGDHMVPLLLTLHPAYLLRQPAHKKLAWRDLQSLAAKMESLGVDAAAGG